MTLEAKFADMKIDDVSSIVDIVKKEGAKKSGLADNITILAAKCDSNSDTEALAALKTLQTLVDECPEVQAFTKECLGTCECIYFHLCPLISSFRKEKTLITTVTLLSC
jgi:hypothetical protein